MKSPREILLTRHRSIEPELDAVRQHALAAALNAPSTTLASRLQVCWHELFWSCRRAWIGLAAVWIVIIAANLPAHDGLRSVASQTPPPARDMAEALKENRQLMAELLGAIEPSEAEPPHSATPRPRSDRRIETAVA